MTPPAVRRGQPPLAVRAVIAAMRAVPALFALGWLVAGAAWLMTGSAARAALALLLAVIAASYGLGAAMWSRH